MTTPNDKPKTLDDCIKEIGIADWPQSAKLAYEKLRDENLKLQNDCAGAQHFSTTYFRERNELRAEVERLTVETKGSINKIYDMRMENLRLESKNLALKKIALKKIAESHRSTLSKLMKLIEDGKLIRDISNDLNPDWGIQQIELVQILSEASAALKESEGK